MRLFITVFAGLLLLITLGECVNERVLLRDVDTITLREGQYTTEVWIRIDPTSKIPSTPDRFVSHLRGVTVENTDYGRRSSPVPQLKCVGGSARGKFKPRAAQCFKQGFDGVDYQWKCVADMPAEYEFGQVTVTCEGYDYPEDPYILKGSCGLEYDLEYSHSARDLGKSKSKWSSLPSLPTWSSWSSWLTVENIANLCVAAFIMYVLYSMLSTSRGGAQPPPHHGGFGGGFDGGPGFGGGYPGHPPPSAPPPSYDDTMGFKTSAPTGSAQSSSSGAGFWTGAGLGALGGYLFGRNTGGSTSGFFDTNNRGYRRTNERFMRDTGFDNHDADQPSTSGIRESTGYGGTRRR